MKSPRGFIVPLLLIIIALLLIGGAYAYMQKKTNQQTILTPAIQATSTVSVVGMSKYTDVYDFGFSFWYPTSWKVSEGHYSLELYDSLGKDTHISIEKSNPANGRVFLPAYACGPAEGCADVTYYFDAAIHTWMKQRGTQTPASADVSMNTMGGLHMLNGNVRFGLGTVVPLDAHKFLIVSAAPAGIGGGKSGTQDYLAKTIVATDPEVAIPVSSVEQIKTIQAEKDAYMAQ